MTLEFPPRNGSRRTSYGYGNGSDRHTAHRVRTGGCILKTDPSIQAALHYACSAVACPSPQNGSTHESLRAAARATCCVGLLFHVNSNSHLAAETSSRLHSSHCTVTLCANRPRNIHLQSCTTAIQPLMLPPTSSLNHITPPPCAAHCALISMHPPHCQENLCQKFSAYSHFTHAHASTATTKARA